MVGARLGAEHDVEDARLVPGPPGRGERLGDLAAARVGQDVGDGGVAAGGDVTTAPVLRADAAPPASLVGLVLDRYTGALALSRAA